MGDLQLLLRPIASNSFVAPERYLRFDFIQPGKIAVFEHGKLVDEAVRTD